MQCRPGPKQGCSLGGHSEPRHLTGTSPGPEQLLKTGAQVVNDVTLVVSNIRPEEGLS